ncbi:MAG: hypothetical protein ACOCP8_03305 [archaeon]
MQINEMKVEMTNHFKKRLKEREVSLDMILYTLRDKIKILRYYNNTGKELCYRSGDISYILEIRNRKIVLITVLNKYADYLKDAIAI